MLHSLADTGGRQAIDGRDMQGAGYQLQPRYVRLVPQVWVEVEAIQVFVDDTEGMCLGRVNTHKQYDIHPSAKEAACADFVMKSLRNVGSISLGATYSCGVPQ